LAARKEKPATQIAQQRGIPRKTLYTWMEAARQHPGEPFVGRGRLPAEGQPLRDLQRQVHRRQEENATVRKAVRLVTNDPK
jgi:transposase